jgi:two-component system, LytTR family, sensor kinase
LKKIPKMSEIITFDLRLKSVIKYSALAWLAYTVIWIWIMAAFIEFGPAIIRVLSISIPEVIVFYLNLLFFIPKFLDAGKRNNYFLVIFLVIAFVTIVGGTADLYLDKYYPFHPFKELERPGYTSFVARFFMTLMPLIVSALVSKSIQVRKQREESLELKNKMLEAETKALKAQINPHFLFNSLNNIYSLAQIKSDKTPDAILHLSDILRFVTYDSNQDYVDLRDELKHIHSFIQLQYLKDDNTSNINIEIDSANGHYKIAPLLLIPFIENCFKHSNHEDKENGWIRIEIKAESGKIKLTCSNSVSQKKQQPKDKTGGVGMENVKKRLVLLYPEKHTLNLNDDLISYNVALEISLNLR